MGTELNPKLPDASPECDCGNGIKKVWNDKIQHLFKKNQYIVYWFIKEYNEDFTLGKLQVSLLKLKRSY